MTDDSFPLAEADRCVKCGLCLPHCPTYAETGHEGDSPRGRIALMQGLADGRLAPTEALRRHLDGCLTCRACEAVCPSGVPYGLLIDAGRRDLARRMPAHTRTARLIGACLILRPLRLIAAWLLWLYQRAGLQRLVRELRLLGSGKLARLESLLPPVRLPASLHLNARAQGASRATVALFTGCLAETAERETLLDASRLLARMGYDVEAPRRQGCCGALHQHSGLAARAGHLARTNVHVFAGEAPILAPATGCVMTLLDYPRIADDPDAAAFAARVRDLCAFVDEAWNNASGTNCGDPRASGGSPAGTRPTDGPRNGEPPLRPFDGTIAVHLPCSQKNALKTDAAVRRLMEKIPGARVAVLDAQARCCGAAGSYFITQPQMADCLLAHHVETVKRIGPAVVVSANVGCRLHLAAGLRRAGLDIPVLHPVSLLARQSL